MNPAPLRERPGFRVSKREISFPGILTPALVVTMGYNVVSSNFPSTQAQKCGNKGHCSYEEICILLAPCLNRFPTRRCGGWDADQQHRLVAIAGNDSGILQCGDSERAQSHD